MMKMNLQCKKASQDSNSQDGYIYDELMCNFNHQNKSSFSTLMKKVTIDKDPQSVIWRLFSTETIIKNREKNFFDNISNEFLRILKRDSFESGCISESENFFLVHFNKDSSNSILWLNELFLENYDNEHVAVGILHTLSHLDYLDVYPEGQTMALAGLSHKSAEVQEYAIKAFENWGNIDSIKYLKCANCHEDWLQRYLAQVICDLEG